MGNAEPWMSFVATTAMVVNWQAAFCAKMKMKKMVVS
jgi:hypothetical protein